MKRLLGLCVFLSVAFSARAQYVTLPNAGVPPFGSVDSTVADTIDRGNLNTNLSIPIYSGTGRGQGLSLALSYNSLLWTQTVYQGNYVWTPVNSTVNGLANWGWNLVNFAGNVFFQTQTGTQCAAGYYTTNYNSFYYIDANGTPHSFPSILLTNTPTQCTGSGWSGTSTGVANDGSGYYMSAPQAVPTVYAKDGTKLVAPTNQPAPSATVTDTNGNYVSTTYAGGGETDIYDTVGRKALKVIQTTNTAIQYEYQDTTGTYQTITVTLPKLQHQNQLRVLSADRRRIHRFR